MKERGDTPLTSGSRGPADRDIRLTQSRIDPAPYLRVGPVALIRQAPGTALLAAEWGPPSGLVVLHWYPTIDADQPTAQIVTLLVGPTERRRGIGRLLVKAASQAARVAGCGVLQLLVAPDQSDLQQFCQATGFAEAGTSFVRPLRKSGLRV